MRCPIIIDEHGDVQIFETVDEAEVALEAVDVRNDEYTAYDSDGTILTISIIDRDDKIRMSADNKSSCSQSELKKVLSNFLQHTGESKETEEMTLQQLIDRYIANHGFAR